MADSNTPRTPSKTEHVLLSVTTLLALVSLTLGWLREPHHSHLLTDLTGQLAEKTVCRLGTQCYDLNHGVLIKVGFLDKRITGTTAVRLDRNDRQRELYSVQVSHRPCWLCCWGLSLLSPSRDVALFSIG